MRIIWWSPTGSVYPTGYGVVSTYAVEQLLDLGHEVYEVVTYGNRNLAVKIGRHKILPNPHRDNGGKAVPRWAEELKADLVIYHGDSWAAHQSLRTLGWPLYIYTVVDHEPMSPLVALATKGPSFIGQALPSRWAIEVCKKDGLDCDYIPYGYDPAIYGPGDRAEARKVQGWSSRQFVYLAVGANYGDRKNITSLMRAFAMLLERRSELKGKVCLAYYGYPTMDQTNPEGYALDYYAYSLGILRDVALPADTEQTLTGCPPETMARMYRAADVFTLPSKAEGFGVPFLEAAACGTPALGTRWSAMPEIIEPYGGWLLDPVELEVGQLTLRGYYGIPSTEQLSKKLEWLYDNQDSVRATGEKAAVWARDWTWEHTKPRWQAILEKCETFISKMGDVNELPPVQESTLIGVGVPLRGDAAGRKGMPKG